MPIEKTLEWSGAAVPPDEEQREDIDNTEKGWRENIKKIVQEYANEDSALGQVAGKAVDYIEKPTLAMESEVKIRGLKENFELELGKGKVPPQLERVFHMMAVDAMEREKLADAAGALKFDEAAGAKSLNVAANLVKLSIGDKTAGFSPGTDIEIENSDGKVESRQIKDIFEVKFNDKHQATGLEIKDHKYFNQLVHELHGHADNLWDDHPEKNRLLGAVSHLNEIRHETWKEIVDAEGLEEVDVEGHDEITDEQIVDFDRSKLVAKAHEVRMRIEAAQAEVDDVII